MNDNQQLREELIDDFQQKLKQEAESTGYGRGYLCTQGPGHVLWIFIRSAESFAQSRHSDDLLSFGE